MALLDRVRDFRRTRQTARALSTIATQLTRIADALERAYPPAVPLAKDSVEILDVNLTDMAHMEAVERSFLGKHGRLPDSEEAMRHYEEIEHLLPR